MGRVYDQDSGIDDIILTDSNAGKGIGPRPKGGAPAFDVTPGRSGELPGKAQPGGRGNGISGGPFDLPNTKGI